MAHILSCPSLAYIYVYQSTHNTIFNSGARDNIFHKSHNTLFLVVYTSALFGSLAPTHDLPPAPLSRGLGAGGQTAPRVLDIGYRRRARHLRRRQVRRTGAHQCACLTTFNPNITLYSSAREQKPQTSNTISNGKYNPVRSIH